eukprot:g45131.t1
MLTVRPGLIFRLVTVEHHCSGSQPSRQHSPRPCLVTGDGAEQHIRAVQPVSLHASQFTNKHENALQTWMSLVGGNEKEGGLGRRRGKGGRELVDWRKENKERPLRKGKAKGFKMNTAPQQCTRRTEIRWC